MITHLHHHLHLPIANQEVDEAIDLLLDATDHIHQVLADRLLTVDTMMRDVHTAMMTATVWTLILAVASTTVMTAMTVMTVTTVVDMITEIDMTDMIIETVMIDMMTEEVVVVVDILPDQDKEDLLRGNYRQNLSLSFLIFIIIISCL
jgi:hypothetical protein